MTQKFKSMQLAIDTIHDVAWYVCAAYRYGCMFCAYYFYLFSLKRGENEPALIA